MCKMDKDGRNKIQRLNKCDSISAPSNLVMGNDLEDPWRRDNPDSSEFNRYDRSCGKRSRIQDRQGLYGHKNC